MTFAAQADTSGNGEITFRFDELFFSRTDEAGIIQSGNSVFQRVAIYTWNEMLGKPHKLVRHPDMPRAVFWLLWNTIKQGEPIGAYVKNRAKDGRFYWVFAIVTPVEGGYLSVRLRPSSDLLGVVKDEYKELAALETRAALAPAASADLLLDRLAELGFRDYPAFMASALSKELCARDVHMRRPTDGIVLLFESLLQASRSLLEKADTISAAYARNEYVTLNFQIQAAQLGQEGATIGVISSNYNRISGDIKSNMNQLIASAQQVFRAINGGLFLICTAKMQQEALAQFRNEQAPDDQSHDQEVLLLDQQQKAYTERAAAGLHAIAKQAEQFRRGCNEMNEMGRLAAGLEVVRIMGKVECSRLATIKDGLNELLDDLEDFQKIIASGLKDISRESLQIQHCADRLLLGAWQQRAEEGVADAHHAAVANIPPETEAA